MTMLEDTLRAHRERRKRLFDSGYVAPPPAPPPIPEPPRPAKPVMISDDQYAKMLAEINRHPVFSRPDSKKILRIVAQDFEITEQEISNHCRRFCYVIPRQIAMYLLVRCMNCTTTFTAQRLKKDHSTVIYGLRSIERRIKSDPGLRARVEHLVKACGLAPLPLPL